MKQAIVACLMLLSASALFAQNKYVYSADLKNISEDRIKIELVPPSIKAAEIVFSFPRVIPGSYSEKSFGKYVEDFTVIDKSGKPMKIKQLNKNQYQIKDPSKIGKITYSVNDTWDTPDKDFIFQPGGSNIEAGKNVVMNNHAFFGYFEGYSKLPFEVNITKPASFYASTHLEVERKSEEKDVLKAKDYVYLADNPVFYCQPDTVSFEVGKTRINVSTYSATGMVKSEQLVGYLKPMALALQDFFNGLPVDSYQFLFYFEDPEKALADKDAGGGGYGALEHNYSSLYFLPELPSEGRLKSMVNDVTSHEFLHILTPLNLHSQHIENFDFVNPKMSKHLWLYEGITEYFSNLVQWQSGIIDQKTFFNNMNEKIQQAAELGDFSMTVMSENVLEDKYQEKYGAVYNRGAVLGLMLDILIREKTQNGKDLKSVIQDLAKRYGPGKPFDDDKFITEFVQASHPAVQAFMDDHIIGDKPLPYAEYFGKLGYDYAEVKRIQVYYAGGVGLRYNEEEQHFVFAEVQTGNVLGIQNGDVFVEIEGNKVTMDNIDEIWENYFQMNRDKPELAIKVKREEKEMVLKGPLRRGFVDAKNYMAPQETLSEQQKDLLNRMSGK